MNRQTLAGFVAAVLLVAALAGCAGGKSQSPAGVGEDLGAISGGSAVDKPGTYVARKGDTLRKIAGRPEIYDDPNLWPILQEANADQLGNGLRVSEGTELKIPRDLTEEQMAEAREKARQAAAAAKAQRQPKPQPTPIEEFQPSEIATPETPVSQIEPTPPLPQSVPRASKRSTLMPVLLVLLLILIALAFILYFFIKKDSAENTKY